QSLRRKRAVPQMRLGQPGPCESERRVELRRTLILSQRFACAFFRIAMGIKPALQIMLMRVDVFRSTFHRRAHFGLNLRLSCRIGRATRELTAQLFYDGLGDLGLDGEDVLQIT